MNKPEPLPQWFLDAQDPRALAKALLASIDEEEAVVTTAVKNGLLTPNEARVKVGKVRLEDGNAG